MDSSDHGSRKRNEEVVVQHDFGAKLCMHINDID